MNQNKRLPYKIINRVALAVIVLASILFPSFIGELYAVTDKQKAEIVNLIVNNHVSGIEESKLDTANIDTIMSSLGDPYTQYFTTEEWVEFMDMLENNYVGIGIRLGQDDHGFFVNEVFPDSPAFSAGLQDGDYITEVEGDSTKELNSEQLVALITGLEGTNVKITIVRNSKSFQLSMTRKAIHVPALSSRWFDNGTGYIAISSFSSDADELFADKLKSMQADGLKSLVIDLRNNPGGLLDTAANMASQFIKDGLLIHTVDRTKSEIDYPIYNQTPLTIPITVLVNEYSASASEVLSGALQDYKLATILGTKTFGKGSVQSLFNLETGGVLKLTIQEYLTPLKHKVNHVGITPDVIVQGAAPQLIAAIQNAGPIDIQLTLSQQALTINGQLFNERFHVIRGQEGIYVPARVLAAIMDETITWDQTTHSIHINGQMINEAFRVGQAVKIIDGISFIELSHFKAQFPGFEWNEQGGQLTLSE